ncbi:transglutaminase, partial [Acidovorax kalamii]
MEALNTRHAWRPVLRPVSGVVIAAQLLLAIQPLSALAQEGGGNTSPAAQAQMQRLAQWQQRIEQAKVEQALAAQPAGAIASQRTSRNLSRVHELLKGIKARTERPVAFNKARSTGSAQASKAAASPEQANQADQIQISELLTAIDADTDAVLADFAALRGQLQTQQVSPEILARHDQAQAELDKRANELRGLIRQWRQAPGATTLAALDAYFERYPAVRVSTPVNPAKLPWSNPTPNQRPPAETKVGWLQNLHKGQEVKLAQAGGGAGGIQFNVPPEPGQAPT